MSDPTTPGPTKRYKNAPMTEVEFRDLKRQSGWKPGDGPIKNPKNYCAADLCGRHLLEHEDTYCEPCKADGGKPLLARCPNCGHMPHAPGPCLNMMSDNDCNCGATHD